MDLVVFVVFACRIFVKPALQAGLRVFGLCGSCVVLVWADLWFLTTCGFWLWSARPFHLMWFLWIGGLARPLCGLADLPASYKQVRRKLRTKHCAQMPMIARFCLLPHKQVTRKLDASRPPVLPTIARGFVVLPSMRAHLAHVDY